MSHVRNTIPGPVIRPVEPADIPFVRQVLIETWRATYDATLGPQKVAEISAEWHSQAAVERQLAAENAAFLLAEVDGAVVATGFARLVSTDRVVVSQLYVLPHMQGQGIGELILRKLLSVFPNAREATLEVEHRNSRAVVFYERQGFAVTGGGEDCGGCNSKVRHLVMTRKLA